MVHRSSKDAGPANDWRNNGGIVSTIKDAALHTGEGTGRIDRAPECLQRRRGAEGDSGDLLLGLCDIRESVCVYVSLTWTTYTSNKINKSHVRAPEASARTSVAIESLRNIVRGGLV